MVLGLVKLDYFALHPLDEPFQGTVATTAFHQQRDVELSFVVVL
jgi:hypothetical protein